MQLFKACLAPSTDGDGSGCDNMTCILVRFKKPSENSTNNGNSSKRSLEDDSTNHSSTSTLNDEHSESNNKRIRNNDDDETIDLVFIDIINDHRSGSMLWSTLFGRY